MKLWDTLRFGFENELLKKTIRDLGISIELKDSVIKRLKDIISEQQKNISMNNEINKLIDHDEIYVSIKEMCITDAPLSIQEAETLMQHSVYASTVRKRSGKPLIVSKKSGHRPKSYEQSKGRTGNSEHSTFHLKDRGAVDYIYDQEQMDIMMTDSFYTRICYYPNNGFIHCDRKPTIRGRKEYFEAASPAAAWKFIKAIENETT